LEKQTKEKSELKERLSMYEGIIQSPSDSDALSPKSNSETDNLEDSAIIKKERHESMDSVLSASLQNRECRRGSV